MTEVVSVYKVDRQPKQRQEKQQEFDLQKKILGRLLCKVINVHLVNGYRLTGVLTAYDRWCLEINGKELVYKSAITTVRRAEERNHEQPTSHNL